MRGNRTILARTRHHPVPSLATSTIVMVELWFGALRAGSSRLLKLIEELQLTILPFEIDDARRAAEVRAYLSGAGLEIGSFDSLIAGQALARNLILVTHNTREFSRVPGLRLEDWEV